MSEENAHEKFERQIERIHQLLESEAAQVTWNDKIPDPDNPNQVRQIDITIRREGKTTLVECRLHKNRQDVTWIEELIGRRASMRADAVIAVSASGFTIGAMTKADKFGVILRTLSTLSEEEIKSWGKSTVLGLIYYEFTESLLTFKLHPGSPIPRQMTLTDARGKPLLLRGVFEQLMRKLEEEKKIEHASGTVTVELLNEMLLGGIAPLACTFRAKVRRIRREAKLASVVAYAAPKDGTPHAHVEKFDMQFFEILQAADEVMVVTDLSQVDPPPDCFFRGVDMDFGRSVEARFKFIGIREAMLSNASIQIRIESSSR